MNVCMYAVQVSYANLFTKAVETNYHDEKAILFLRISDI